jgi:hypothetical protein
MPTPAIKARSTGNETKFSVGWQKLTTDEFLNALTAAVLEKIQTYTLGTNSAVLQLARSSTNRN